MKTECRRFKRPLGRYVDGAVSSAMRADIEAHLAGCAACRQEVDALAELGGVLRGGISPGQVPEAFASRVVARASTASAQPKVVSLPWIQNQEWWYAAAWPVRTAAAAVLVIGLAVGGLMGWDLGQDGESVASVEGESNGLAAYSLDYLGDVPEG